MLDGARVKPELETYMDEASRGRSLIVNIESVPAISVLDAILAEPGLDAVLIGPHDLSCSLGVPEQYAHPKFLAACETILGRARRAGRRAGIHYWGSAAEQARFAGLGANLMIHSSDFTLVKKHLRAELSAVKAAVAPPAS